MIRIKLLIIYLLLVSKLLLWITTLKSFCWTWSWLLKRNCWVLTWVCRILCTFSSSRSIYLSIIYGIQSLVHSDSWRWFELLDRLPISNSCTRILLVSTWLNLLLLNIMWLLIHICSWIQSPIWSCSILRHFLQTIGSRSLAQNWILLRILALIHITFLVSIVLIITLILNVIISLMIYQLIRFKLLITNWV